MRNKFLISFGAGGGTLCNIFAKKVFNVPKTRILQFQTNKADGRSLINPIDLADGGTRTRIEEVYSDMSKKHWKVIQKVFDDLNVNDADVTFFTSCGGTGSGGAKFVVPKLIERGCKVTLIVIHPFLANRNPYFANFYSLFMGNNGLFKYTREKDPQKRLNVFVVSNEQITQKIKHEEGLGKDSHVSIDTINAEIVSLYREIIEFPSIFITDANVGKFVYDKSQHNALIDIGGGAIGYFRMPVLTNETPSRTVQEKIHDLHIGKLSKAGDIGVILCIGTPINEERIKKAEEYIIALQDIVEKINHQAVRYFGAAQSYDEKDRLYIIAGQCSMDKILKQAKKIAVETQVRRMDHSKDKIEIENDVQDVLDSI